MRRLAAVLVIVSAGCTGEFRVDEVEFQRARAEADRAVLVDALDTVKGWHGRTATGLVDRLNPGSSEERLLALFESLDLSPTEELIALWSWHDGESSEHPLIWYHDFLSAEEAVREYRGLLRNPMVRWDPNYVPVFSFEGEWYGVYCASEKIPAGPVVHYFIEDEPKTSFTNLTTMLATMAEALESGAVSWDADHRAMTEDILELSRIHARHNPGVPFPYYVENTAAR